MEYLSRGSTSTLYCHGIFRAAIWAVLRNCGILPLLCSVLSHHWDLPRLPIDLSDEAGEARLRSSKRFAGVTSTQPACSGADRLKHEAYSSHFFVFCISFHKEVRRSMLSCTPNGPAELRDLLVCGSRSSDRSSWRGALKAQRSKWNFYLFVVKLCRQVGRVNGHCIPHRCTEKISTSYGIFIWNLWKIFHDFV